MSSVVYDKTDKGREEIATRKYQVPARMRTLLVLVDGRRDLDWLLSNIAGLGLNQQSIDELLAQDFIRMVPGTAPAPVEVESAAPNPVSARARAVAKQAARLNASASHLDAIDDAIASSEAVQVSPVAPAVAPAVAAAPAASVVALDTAEQFRQLYAYYNHSIKAAIGLRGVMLQLKVEKAVTVADLRELRTPFLQAVIKAKGGELAAAMRDELDGLLGGAPAVDEVVIAAPGQPAKGGLDFFNMSGGAVEY
ncbi:MAG: hypothetical protein ACJ8HI_06170 [Massilia sp.]